MQNCNKLACTNEDRYNFSDITIDQDKINKAFKESIRRAFFSKHAQKT